MVSPPGKLTATPRQLNTGDGAALLETQSSRAVIMQSGPAAAGDELAVAPAGMHSRADGRIARVALGMSLAARLSERGVDVVAHALPLGAAAHAPTPPRRPLELARATLADPRAHTAQELAESIYFWSQHVVVDAREPATALPATPLPPQPTSPSYPSIAATGGVPAIGWTRFSIDRQLGPGAFSRFDGPPEELLHLLRDAWPKRLPGAGRSNLDEVVRVPLPAERFTCATTTIDGATPLRAVVDRRRPHEDCFVKVLADTKPDAPAFAEVVLYSARLLRADSDPTFVPDWGITAIIASPVANEPMNPLTMARNFLKKPGGSFAPYSATQLAEAIVYWSTRAFVG